MEDSADRLIKILNRELKDKREEINYYRNLLWDITHSEEPCDGPHVFDTSPDQNSFPIPEPEERQGEPTGINGTEEMVAKIIGDILDV